MSTKKIVVTISILSTFVIALFIYPFINQSLKAEQINKTGYTHQIISFRDAAELIKNSERIIASDAVIAQYFGKELVDKILAQPGCVGVRLYYGKNANGKSGVIILGVDKYGKDMITGVLAWPTSKPCPPYCGDTQ